MRIFYDECGIDGPDFYTEIKPELKKDRHIMNLIFDHGLTETNKQLLINAGYDLKTFQISIEKIK